MRTYYVYIMTNRSGTLYVGVTNDLERRVSEHRSGDTPGFTTRYRLNRLLYYEDYPDPRSAIDREKEIKGWRRARKLELIQDSNPQWDDLAADWFGNAVRDVAGEGPDSSLRSE